MILVLGPCVAESLSLCQEIAHKLKYIEERINYNRDDKIKVFLKGSYSKNNRSAINSYVGPGLEKGLKILEQVKREFNIPVTSDIHECCEAKPAGEVLDLIQIPSLLARQSFLILAAARTGKAVNVKKGQMMSSFDMKHVKKKLEEGGCGDFYFTERGACFGRGELVNDFVDFVDMRKIGRTIFDGSHSTQKRSPNSDTTLGRRDMVEVLLRCAVAAGCDGLFVETHPNPDKALSDASIAYPLDQLENMLNRVLMINDLTAKYVIQSDAKFILS